jgi:hypothetical protein
MHVRFRWILAVIVIPFIILGLVVLAAKIYGLFRFERSYFGQEYQELYDTPGAVARALEGVLRGDDPQLLAELQGLRWTAEFETAPSMILIMLWERTDRYMTYLFFDMQSYERHAHYFEKVQGRWVVSPTDLYYYIHSGAWQRVFWPIATVWWLLGAVAIGAVWVFRASERMRARLHGEE